MGRQRAFRTVDVFTAVPLLGNPVAVILDGEGLSSEAMQAIANWTNLSETTFVLPASEAGADYHLRIFTPRAELPFAGHPTIGSAHAILEAGLAVPRGGRIVQQCGVGLVEISVPDDWRGEGLSFRLPAASFSDAPESDLLACAIGAPLLAPARIVDVGPRWVIAELADGEVVSAVAPDLAVLADYDRRHRTTGLTIFGMGSDGPVVRSFAPADGIAEDPVCGSGNGAVAAYRLAAGQVAAGDAYVARQGMSIGRNGRVTIRYAADGIHVGGRAVTVIQGQLQI
jgi:PhzF family phenazine biosynthesis protein